MITNLGPVHMGSTIHINGQEIVTGTTIGLQPMGAGITAVTLTVFTDNLTIDWEALPAKVEIIAPEEIMNGQRHLAENDDKPSTST